MARLLSAQRGAAVVAGAAGLWWFWAELAPQRAGFPDTDNPAAGLQFLAAHPEAWVQAGFALAILAIALIVTVLSMGDRLKAAVDPEGHGVAIRTVTVLGLIAAAMLLGMACVRLAGEPLRYVQSLDQAWGEAAYLVTQFVGVQLLLVGALAVLAMWIAGVAWIGGRSGAIPRLVAVVAILPAIRLIALPVVPDIVPEVLWLVAIAAVPAAFAWLILLGAWRPSGEPFAAPVAPRPSQATL
jgi:hypothetical protein